MARVLLLSPRAPVTLEMARHLHAAGHDAFVADSQRVHLCSFSSAVRRSFVVPRPRQEHAAWIDALVRIVEHERIEHVIPTCEEAFWLSLGRETLAQRTRVLVDGFDTMMALHDKARFISHARALGFAVPETHVFDDRQALIAHVDAHAGDVVVKAVFSRFGSKALMRPSRRAIAQLAIDARSPYVVQRFVSGRQLSTYSVAQRGRLALHATYTGPWRAGQGASVSFVDVAHEGARAFTERVVESFAYTGQIAFDFIEDESGALWPIECNPRATSGLHLFPRDGRAARALLDDEVRETVTPPAGAHAQLLGAVLLYAPLAVRSLDDARRLVRDVFAARDVVFDWRDPAAVVMQALSSLGIAWTALRHRTGLLAATTIDIEHNGPVAEGRALALPPRGVDDAHQGARHAA